MEGRGRRDGVLSQNDEESRTYMYGIFTQRERDQFSNTINEGYYPTGTNCNIWFQSTPP